MSAKAQKTPEKILAVKSFLFREREAEVDTWLPAVSLFAGGGLSDLGYELAGFEFVVHAEKEENRAILCAENFPDAESVVGELQDTWQIVVQNYLQKRRSDRLALLSVTPPCQGMSHSNPGRGRRSDGQGRDDRNRLMLEAIPVIEALQPRIVVVENVPQLLTEPNGTAEDGKKQRLVEAFAERLPKYFLFGRAVQMADYGLAQDRRRAIIVAVHEEESWARSLLSAGVGPWPARTHAREPQDGLPPWVTVEEWFGEIGYKELDARSSETACDPDDPLHLVSVYEGDYYWRVADIPPRSGRSAYENPNCRECGRTNIPEDTARCPCCGAIMHNRPYIVEEDGTVRLIKGRHSSYRRMRHDEPARTITTASSHVGSDYKVHPWENRVLSIRECADLQTVPRFYDWSWALETQHTYLVRQVTGEALPPWFTYLQGQLLHQLLDGREVPTSAFARARWAREALSEC